MDALAHGTPSTVRGHLRGEPAPCVTMVDGALCVATAARIHLGVPARSGQQVCSGSAGPVATIRGVVRVREPAATC